MSFPQDHVAEGKLLSNVLGPCFLGKTTSPNQQKIFGGGLVTTQFRKSEIAIFFVVLPASWFLVSGLGTEGLAANFKA